MFRKSAFYSIRQDKVENPNMSVGHFRRDKRDCRTCYAIGRNLATGNIWFEFWLKLRLSLGIFLSRLSVGDPWGDGPTFQITSYYLIMIINFLSYNVVIYQASIWPEKSTIKLVTATFSACLSPCWNSSCYNVFV
jgi:hypothetical protein